MALDETIKQLDEMVEANQKVVDTHVIWHDTNGDSVTLDEIYADDTEIIEERLADFKNDADKYRQLADWLRELKTLRKQNEWIPVNESLPEHHQRVLVTVRRYDESNVVRVAEYWGKCKKVFKILENSEEWEVGEKGLLGWKPLPEPWEPCDFASMYPVWKATLDAWIADKEGE